MAIADPLSRLARQEHQLDNLRPPANAGDASEGITFISAQRT